MEDVADRRGINQNESRPKIVVCPGGLGGENYIVDSSDKKVDTESCLVPLNTAMYCKSSYVGGG